MDAILKKPMRHHECLSKRIAVPLGFPRGTAHRSKETAFRKSSEVELMLNAEDVGLAITIFSLPHGVGKAELVGMAVEVDV